MASCQTESRLIQIIPIWFAWKQCGSVDLAPVHLAIFPELLLRRSAGTRPHEYAEFVASLRAGTLKRGRTQNQPQRTQSAVFHGSYPNRVHAQPEARSRACPNEASSKTRRSARKIHNYARPLTVNLRRSWCLPQRASRLRRRPYSATQGLDCVPGYAVYFRLYGAISVLAHRRAREYCRCPGHGGRRIPLLCPSFCVGLARHHWFVAWCAADLRAVPSWARRGKYRRAHRWLGGLRL